MWLNELDADAKHMKNCVGLVCTWMLLLTFARGAENSNVLACSDTIRDLVVGRQIEPAFSNTLAKAQSGDVNAQVALGNVFAEGLYGVPRNDVEAMRWYYRAALAGNSVGQYLLASGYEQGKGTPKNLEQAIIWFRKSANQGYASAQAALGILYQNGEGLPIDRLEAYKWFAIAANAGDVKANEEKLKLAKLMPLRDIAEAEYRAGAFRPVDSTLAGRKPQDDSPPPKSLEAGFFITTNGYFLAPLHVIKDAKRIMVKTTTGLYPARMVKGDLLADLAVLKVEGTFPALPLAARPGPGEKIFIPQFNNEDWKAAAISVRQAKIVSPAASSTNSFGIQIERPGENAGGCVVDANGAAIGLVTFQQFVPNQREARLLATAFPSLKRVFQTLPEVRSSVQWAAPRGPNGTRPEAAIQKSSALVLAY